MTTPVRLNRSDVQWFPELAQRLEASVRAFDLSETEEWSELEILSTRTAYEGLEVDADLVIKDGRGLRAPGTVYVRLSFGEDGDAGLRESFPAQIFFSVNAGEVVIERVVVDTSSFFQ